MAANEIARDGCQVVKDEAGRIIGHVRRLRTGGWVWHAGRGSCHPSVPERTKAGAIVAITEWRALRRKIRSDALREVAYRPTGERVEVEDLIEGRRYFLPTRTVRLDAQRIPAGWRPIEVAGVIDCGTGCYVVRGTAGPEDVRLVTPRFASFGAIEIDDDE